jgi:ATP-dependent Lon protease
MTSKKQEDYLKDIQKKLKDERLPADLVEKAEEEVRRLQLIQQGEAFWQGLNQLSHWSDWITALPWKEKTKDILDLDHAKTVLDESHYGLDKIKNRILEYLSVLILKEKRREGKVRAPVLCFVGLVGTGKTTIAKSIAEALGRKFMRIPFGGLGDPLYLRGQSRIHPEAEPGQVIKGLRQAEAKNPVILLDEIDRVADDSLNTIMGVLVELLDPEQNDRFSDYFIDYPFDLSEAIFIATANHTRRIATAVMDRLEVLQMPSYSDDEKIAIGKDYLLPKAIEQTGLNSNEISFEERVWPKITRPLGYDAGVRTLYRNIESICRRVARQIVEGEKKQVNITVENVNNYLPL